MAQILQVKAGREQVQTADGLLRDEGEVLILTDEQFDRLATASLTSDLTDLGPGLLVTAPTLLNGITDAGQVVATIVPGFIGQVRSVLAIVTTAVTTASKAAVIGTYIDQVVGTNEVATLTITGTPTGGTFTVTVAGRTTAGVAYNASAATLRAAIEALSNVSPGDVTVTGSAGGPYTITFGGQLAETDLAVSSSGASLTGGTSPAATTVETTPGVAVSGAATRLSGGTVSLTSALATPTGTKIVGSNVVPMDGAGASPNTFGVDSAITLRAVGAPTAFSEGAVIFAVLVDPLDRI